MARDRAVDWARGIAALAMIEGHALHGWASAAARQTDAYTWTRVVATSPLPAFMLLSGIAVRLRIGVAEARGEDPRTLRAGIAWRGLQVVLWGYAASAAYAMIDGHQGLVTFLRADVLHVIGLSIAAMAWACITPAAPVDAGRASRRALWLTLGVTLLTPLYYLLAPTPTGPLRYALAPLVRVPEVTIFPLLPMLAWSSVGFVVGDLLSRARARTSEARVYGGAAVIALAVAWGCEQITRQLLAGGATLGDADPAGIVNMTGYAARGVVLIGVAPLLVARLPAALQTAVGRLGRASLVAYVFHIPFCYGLPGTPVRGKLEMLDSVPHVVALWFASYGVVVLLPWLKARAVGLGRLLQQSPEESMIHR